MKLFSKMLSKKTVPENQVENVELDMDVEPLRRRDEPMADDSGEVNATVSSDTKSGNDPLYANSAQPVHNRDEEPEEVEGAGWGGNEWDEDEWDDDEDWGDDEQDKAEAAAEANAQEEKAHLVGEIRDAVVSVSHISSADPRKVSEPRQKSEPPNWSNDEEFGRKAIARNRLSTEVENSQDRLLRKTNTEMTSRETSRRRSAMAHLKAAAQATKADRVLKHVVGRDPTADPEEQSPYRDDLAKVVRPRSTSRPISRPVSRPRTEPAPWDQGTSDDDAAQFAAASEASLMPKATSEYEAEEVAAQEERLANAPADLSADEFADDNFFGGGFDDEDDEFEDETSLDDESEGFEANEASVTASDSEAIEDEAGDSNWSNRFQSDEDEKIENNTISDDNEDVSDDEDASEETLVGDEIVKEDNGPVASSVVSDVVAFANAPEESGSTDDDEIVRRKIWEMAGDSATVKETTIQEATDEAIVNVGAAVSGRSGRSAGRVKTRLLGFQATDDSAPQDVFETAKAAASETNQTKFPVGWIVVIEGPGRGACFTMFNGVTNIGRGEDQAVRLDFGDTSISRHNHAAVAFDDEQGKFFLGHGGKSNLVRLNGSPVLSTEELAASDQIRIGETTLKFIGLCDENFKWTDTSDEIEGTDAD
jgi:hypothetical protein